MSEPTPSRPAADRNLLFGILALQLDFITRDALITAMHAWVLDKAKPLGQVLVDQGTIGADRHALLEALVLEHLKHHDNAAEKSLASVQPPLPLCRELEQIGDGDLQLTLTHLGRLPAEWDPRVSEAAAGGMAHPGPRYQILRWHARGGLGEVFVARDEELDRKVALKQIQEAFADLPESRTRFMLEAKITAGLEHPGIVPVYGLGAYPCGRPFYTMRFIQGESLQHAIEGLHQAGGDIPGEAADGVGLRKLLGRFLGACHAIAYAHSRGVLHRDLKPGNIMLGRYGETLVVDWGLAKVIGQPDDLGAASTHTRWPASWGTPSQTQTGVALGTPPYMSPEQAAGQMEQLGPASDVYSLGATLYCLLTGQPPFHDSDLGRLLQQVQRGAFPPPRQVRAAIPPELEALCLKAMALKPEDRHQSASVLAEDIQQWLASEADLQRARAEEQEELARRYLYTAHMNLAQRAWHAQQLALMRELLERHRPRHPEDRDLRGFEWYYLWRICHPLIRTILAHTGQVQQIVVSSDSQWLASAGDDALVKVWDASTGRERLTLKGHSGRVTGLSFNPRGDRLASVSEDGTVRVWDTDTGREVLCLPRYTDLACGVAFSPDGGLIASSAPSNRLRLWEASTGQALFCGLPEGGQITCLAFSPTGPELAIALESPGLFPRTRRRPIQVWDVPTGHMRLELEDVNAQTIRNVAFSPTGKELASASDDATIHLWDLKTGKVVRCLKWEDGRSDDLDDVDDEGPTDVGNPIKSVAFSPDGRRLVAGSSGQRLRVWDLRTDEVVPSFCRHSKEDGGKPSDPQDQFYASKSVAFSPSGHWFASAGEEGNIAWWDATTGNYPLSLGRHSGSVLSVIFAPNGQLFATGSYGEAKLWDATACRELLEVRHAGGWVTGLSFSPDGERLALSSQNQAPTVYEARTGRVLLHLKALADIVNCIAFHPGGQWLAVGAADGSARLYDAGSGQEVLCLPAHSRPVLSVAFDPEGRWLATASTNRSVKVWDFARGVEVHALGGQRTPHSGYVASVSFSPDGHWLASGSFDKTIKIFDMSSGKELRTLRGHAGWVRSIAFNPDGTRLASGSNDETVRLWDTLAGEEILTLQGHTDRVRSLAFSPDGTCLISGSDDRTVKVWCSGRPADTPPQSTQLGSPD
jgi:WD40 repeat protein/serine/threonine protein kinase